MASTEATLAWALQVDVLTLGVHFEAYVNLLPTIETLRLCNRFGRGAQAAVQTLPPELVKLVEDILISDERLELRRLWHQELRCYEHLCEPIEHIEEERYERLWPAELKGCGIMPEGWHGFESDDVDWKSMDTYEALCQKLEDNDEYWARTHEYLRESWEGRVGLRLKHDNGQFSSPFARHRDILEKHFNLEIWTSNVRLKYNGPVRFWQDQTSEPACTTIAFLKLPGSNKHCIKASPTDCESDNRRYRIEHGAGAPVIIPSPLSTSDRRKFRRTVSVLDLKPYLKNDSQKRSVLSTETSTLLPDLGREPRLIVLMKQTISSEEL